MPPDWTEEDVVVAIVEIRTELKNLSENVKKVIDDHEARLRSIEDSNRAWKWGQGIFSTVLAGIAAVIGYQK